MKTFLITVVVAFTLLISEPFIAELSPHLHGGMIGAMAAMTGLFIAEKLEKTS